MTLNVLPSLSLYDSSNAWSAYAKQFCQLILRRAFCGELSNNLHVMREELCQMPYLFAFRGVLSSLTRAVTLVVSVSPKKKMSRIAAWWIVAFVKHIEASIKLAMTKQISHAMGHVVVPLVPEQAVTLLHSACRFPRPTLLWSALGNVAPKSCFGWPPSFQRGGVHQVRRSRFRFAFTRFSTLTPKCCRRFRNLAHSSIMLNRLSMSRKAAC